MISKPSDIHGDMARKLNAIEHQIGFNDTCLTSKLDLQKLIHHYLIATSFLQKKADCIRPLRNASFVFVRTNILM